MTTYPPLLEQFLQEECTPHVRNLICGAASSPEPGSRQKQFEFNRFNLLMDFEAGLATLEDETDVTPSGSIDLRLDDLITVLQCGRSST